jgi:hypothetical protein
MILRFTIFKSSIIFRIGIIFLLTAFLVTSSGLWEVSQAQTVFNLPEPGTLVPTSISFNPLQLKGVLVDTKNPLRFNFLVDKGDSGLYGQSLKNEISRLAKYFLTCLTVPENDLWVNLSPYEKDRIVPGNFGFTLMGKDLLEQDYLLKQIMASLSYPENELGRRFWQRVYRKSYELYGTTEIPINTFNKVWILPKSAEVYVQGNRAFLVNSQLDVMLEADYKSFIQHHHILKSAGTYSQVYRDVILPELRQEVNTGKNFAVVRQVYSAMILATWYKRHLKDSILGRMYVGKNAVHGVDIADKNAKQKIFQQYLKAYKKCVYNYIKEDYDPMTEQTVPRKYASGGMNFTKFTFGSGDKAMYTEVFNLPKRTEIGTDLAMATIMMIPTNGNGEKIVLNHPFYNPAMLVSLRKSFSHWIFGTMLAVSAAATPLMMQGAPFFQDQKNSTQGAETDPEKIFEKNSQQGMSEVKAPILTQQQSIASEDHKDQVSMAKQEIPNIDDSDPEIIFKRNQEQAIREQVAADSTETQTFKGVSSGSPVLPDKEDTWLKAKIGIGLAVLFGIGAGWRKRYALSGLFNKLKSTPPAVPPALPPPESMLTDEQLPVNGSHLLDVALLPAAASTGEAAVLASDLEKVKAIAEGRVAVQSPIIAEEDEQTARNAGQNLKWMDVAALFAGLALSVSLGGGIPLILLRAAGMLFGVRAFYVLQRTLHEKFHLLAASLPGVYAEKIKDIWTGSNLRDNRSLGEWVKSFIPFVRSQRPMVNMPFANVENSFWKNKFISWAGLLGSVALPFIALHMPPFILAAVGLSAAWVLIGSILSGDLFGSQDTDEGRFGCGIIVLVKRIPSSGISRKEMGPLLSYFKGNMKQLTVRGVQQAGLRSNLAGNNPIAKQTKQLRNWKFWQGWFRPVLDQKKSKEMYGWKFWKNWQGPVLYRDMIDDLFNRFEANLPRHLVPVYNYGKFGVIKFLAHVRFATGGAMVPEAAHPFASPAERREVWTYDAIQKKFRKIVRFFQITSAFNGDHDGSNIGILYRKLLKGRQLSFAHMRSFYAVVVGKYYEGEVSKKYLKKVLTFGQIPRIGDKTDYGAILEAMYKKGYIDFWGKVNRRFKGFDDEFKKNFPDYIKTFSGKEKKSLESKYLDPESEEYKAWKEQSFNELESALFGMPPGDAPILPLEQHLDLTQGDWFASVRYAHVMANHRDLEEARDDILFEKEGRAISRIYSEVYDQLEPYITRRGFDPKDPELIRNLSDCYVKDEQTAKRLGLEGQYEMLKIFKQMLYDRIKEETSKNTLAGEVFRQWEVKWQQQGEDPGRMRRVFINVAVEKFFTADNIAATKEFAESSDGTYGLYFSSSLDDSITFYQDNQDVVIGLNRKDEYFGAASDPRVLKSIGTNGEKFDEVIHLQDGEVANVSFSPSGKIIFRSWKRIKGEWVETSPKELEERFYPTAEYVDGKKNEYYASGGVEYKNPRKIVQQDEQNTTKILSIEQEKLNDPESFNAQSTDYLHQRIKDMINKNGKARMYLIGFDNSYLLSTQFKTFGEDLFDHSKLEIIVIDSNEYDKSPSKYNIKHDDIVLAVSKSGATFSTKLALRLVKTLVNPENIFCMGARIDSVLNTVIGQGLRPGRDKFTKRVFVTGEFYPSETPVISEILLAFQLQQLAINLARKLEPLNERTKTPLVKFSASRLDVIKRNITEESFRLAEEITGFDKNGKESTRADKGKKSIGTYLGKVAKEQFYKAWFMKVFVYGVLTWPSWLLARHFGLGPAGTLALMGAVFDVFWLSNLVPFLVARYYRSKIGRPEDAGHNNFKLFIAGPDVVNETQRNFFSRLMTNKLGLIGPVGTWGGNPETNFTARYASDVDPNSIILRFFLAHKPYVGKMGVNQTGFPVTETFGPTFGGKAEIIDVKINVHHPEGASKEETNLMDNTVGFLGMMLASKQIGVTMGDEASFGGRLFNLAYTFSSAGVYTTQINPISEEARKMLDSGREVIGPAIEDDSVVVPAKMEIPDAAEQKQLELKYIRYRARQKQAEESAVDEQKRIELKYLRYRARQKREQELLANQAMKPMTRIRNPGGIDMNSRLMQLKVTGEDQRGIGSMDNSMIGPMIRGLVPQVSGVITVTQDMLKEMLGAGYLN